MKHFKIISLVVIFAVLSVSSALGVEKVSVPLRYSGYSIPEYNDFTRIAQYVAMQDGTKIATVAYIPAEGPSDGPFPAIVSYVPYHYEVIDPVSGEKITHFDLQAVEFYTSHGYALVMTDFRGGGVSEGSRTEFEPLLAEDGKELIEWIGNQTWCDGNVGLIGISYPGWSTYATAGRKPSALKCIIPGYFSFDEYSRNDQYPGGICNRRGDLWGPAFYNLNMYWPGFYMTPLGLPSTPMVDEDGDGDLHDEIPIYQQEIPGLGLFNFVGFAPEYIDGNARDDVYLGITLQHLANPFLVNRSLQFRDEPWVEGDSRSADKFGPNDYPIQIAESGIPIYNEGGWMDGFLRGTTEWHATLAHTNQSRMIIGPFLHCYPGMIENLPKGPYVELNGENSTEIGQAMNRERLRFLDRHLKGIRNGIDTEPPVLIYVMNGEGWRGESEWPLSRQKMTKYYFGPDNSLDKGKKRPGTEEYVADFTHDTRQEGTGANRWNRGPTDMVFKRTEMDKKCLTYTMGKSLKKDMEVTGHPIVTLYASSTADNGDFFVYLEDVNENGEALFVTDGQLRAGFAGLVPNEDMLPPGSNLDVKPELPWHGYKKSDYVDDIFANGNVVELVFDLMPTSWVFKKGHKIRVTVACADWPTFDLHPNLSPSNNPSDPANIVPTITMHRTPQYRSHIELPVIPTRGHGNDEDDDESDDD